MRSSSKARGFQLQWGHGDEAVEEATPVEQLHPPGFCFNGATAMKPWKRRRLQRLDPGCICFNGATAMKPWKRITDLQNKLAEEQLQWGHGDEAVEEYDLVGNKDG